MTALQWQKGERRSFHIKGERRSSHVCFRVWPSCVCQWVVVVVDGLKDWVMATLFSRQITLIQTCIPPIVRKYGVSPNVFLHALQQVFGGWGSYR